MPGFPLRSKWFRDSGRRGASRPPRPAPPRLALEALAERVLPAVTATYSAAGMTLKIVADDLDNTVVVSRTAAGTILVNNGAVAIQGGPATVANTSLIMINGLGGNDALALDELNGPLPMAALFGGDGNDTLVGGSGADFAEGGAGSDTAFLGAGDDTFSWQPGDGSDVVEGQGGRDALNFIGSDAAEKLDLSANGTRARFTRDVGGVVMDLNGVEEIDLLALGGADTVTVNDQSTTGLNTFNLDLSGTAGTGDNQTDTVIINGTDGNDVGQIRSVGTRIDATVSAIPFVHITGEDGLDALAVNLLGGNDALDASDLAATNASQLVKLTVNGGAGNDTIVGSQGADTFVWNPGDGSDTIDGGDNPDTLVFNGSDQAEKLDLSANGGRVRLTRDLGGVTMDLGGVETVTVNALGGADAVTVNDLTGTAVSQINLDLAGVAGSGVGDGRADAVIVNGGNAADRLPVHGANGTVLVDGGFLGGLPYFTVIRAVEAADTLQVNGNGGDDTIDASTLAAAVTFTANGGAGADTIFGSPADDTFLWNPGDGSDTIDGQAGLDKLTFNGSDLAENVVLARNGSHVRLARDLGNVTMDLNAVEGIEINALGGADTVTVNDLTGTGVVKVQLSLNGSAGGGDGQPDTVIVNGTNGDDAIRVAAVGNTVLVDGLFPAVRITGSDGTADHLMVNALGGNDTVDASNLPAGLIGLTVDLGDGQAAPRVAGVVVNGGSAQRSRVTQLRVAFDRHVTLPANPADAFRLVRRGDGAAVTLRAVVDDSGSGTVVTLTFTGGAVDVASLADGRYTLTVLAGQVSGPNGPLDGDGDGVAGGDFVLAGDPASNRLFRLFGDGDGNGVVDAQDLFRFAGTFGHAAPDPADLAAFDVNGDGAVDAVDLFAFAGDFGKALP